MNIISRLDDQRQRQAREYAALRRKLFFVDEAVGGVFLLALLLSGLSLRLREALPFAWPVQVALYFVVFVVVYGAVQAPLSFYSGFILPRRYGLSTQGLRGWLVDLAKGGVVGLVLGLLALEVLYFLLGTFPTIWWLPAGVAALVFSAVLANLAPIILLPLFFTFVPLADEHLVQRLSRLAERAGARVRGVFTMNLSSKSTTANAALMGWGNTRRIVLSDTLLDRYTPDEIEVVLAHELGHHVHRDIPKMILSQSALTLLSFYLSSLVLDRFAAPLGLSGPADVAGLPLLALSLGLLALVFHPIGHTFSRHIEQQADTYALSMTDNPSAFVSVMDRLTDQNLSESRPARWVEFFFLDHPPHAKRVEMARSYAEDGKLDTGKSSS